MIVDMFDASSGGFIKENEFFTYTDSAVYTEPANRGQALRMDSVSGVPGTPVSDRTFLEATPRPGVKYRYIGIEATMLALDVDQATYPTFVYVDIYKPGNIGTIIPTHALVAPTAGFFITDRRAVVTCRINVRNSISGYNKFSMIPFQVPRPGMVYDSRIILDIFAQVSGTDYVAQPVAFSCENFTGQYYPDRARRPVVAVEILPKGNVFAFGQNSLYVDKFEGSNPN